jgi:hypothetical protein
MVKKPPAALTAFQNFLLENNICSTLKININPLKIPVQKYKLGVKTIKKITGEHIAVNLLSSKRLRPLFTN